MKVKRKSTLKEIGGKIIKKTGKVLAWILGILLLLIFDLYFALKNPRVQTWVTQRIASYMSDELKTKITIQGVDIEFFKKIVLKGIYVEDQHGDTLLYADKFKVDITRFSYDNKYMNISTIDLDNAFVKVKKYKGEKGLNYRFITQYFKTTDTTRHTSSAPWKIDFGGVNLNNINFAYVDTRDTINDPGMDYENIRVSGIKGKLADINPMGDSVSLRIKNLQGTERCGLALKDFNTLMTVSDSCARLDNLNFITKGSSVNGFIAFYYNSTDDIADDFVHLVKMDGHFSTSVIEMGDVAYFSPNLLGMKKKVMFTGDIKGTVEHLKCKNVDVRFGESSHVAGNFYFNGLPDINQTDMNFKIREATINKKDLEGIPVAPFEKGKNLEVADNIGLLGEMKFSGSFEGFLNDFVAVGKLNTAIGTLTMENLAMTRDTSTEPYSYDGEVRSDQFNVGSFFGIPDMSVVTGDVTIKGSGLSSDDINANIDGKISSLNYHNYNYQNITVSNANIKKQVFKGDVVVNDSNVKVIFNGEVDNSGAMPKMKFTADIDSANLGKLGFLDNDHEYFLTTDLEMDFSGNNIDNLNGHMGVNNLSYIKDGEKFNFNEFDLYGQGDPEKDRTIFLRSDIVVITLKGKFKVLELPHSFSDIMSNYLPAYFPPENESQSKKDAVQEFNWYVTFQQNTKPVEVIIPGLKIAPQTQFNGNFNSTQNKFRSNLNSSSVVYNDIEYNHITMNSDNYISFPGQCALRLKMDELKITDTIGVKNFDLSCIATHDSLYTVWAWDNHTQKLNDCDMDLLFHFDNEQSFKMDFDSTFIHIDDSLWTVMPGNYMRKDSSKFTFHNLTFRSGTQSIGLDGIISPRPHDELNISMTDFNIGYLNYFTKQSGITVSGFIPNSKTSISDFYHTPIFTSNTDFQKLYINEQNIGDGSIDANWLEAKNAVRLDGHFSRGIPDPTTGQNVDNIQFGGFYYPKKKENSLDISSNFINIPLDVLQPLLKDFCSMMKGQMDGDLHIGGTPDKPLLTGQMGVAIKRVKVDYLGLTLDPTGTEQIVKIEENSFFFNNFKVSDGYGDTAKIYGHLFHDNFKNFQFDMDFSFDHFLVLNTTAADNELYYGRVFASGFMNIFGYVDDIVRIDMTVTSTDKIYHNGKTLNSEFYIPMTSTSEASSTDFITFEDSLKSGINIKPKAIRNSGVDLYLNITPTPDMMVKVVFDKTVGDELTAYGSGNLNLHIPPTGDFTIRGQYAVDEGKYLFTMKNLVYVQFDLAKGGLISWNGDPYEAQINADAVYKTNTSVEPFFPMDSTNKAYHRNYPVDVVMHLEKNLMNPDVSFDINLPTADQNIQETVRSYTSTDLEKNRQVLSLMVLNSFMTPSELREGGGANQNVVGGTSATLLSNFVSGTLNNWLGQISSDYTMTMKYRPNDDLTTAELKVYLQTQFLNNKITVDVDAGKINSSQVTSSTTNSQWVGDVNVEYKATADGKVRFRAFNRSNDNVVLNENSPYTQGVGVFYREDFETWGELMKRYKDAITSQNPNRNKVPKPNTVNAPDTTLPQDSIPAAKDSIH
jgi:hypothetical protein